LLFFRVWEEKRTFAKVKGGNVGFFLKIVAVTSKATGPQVCLGLGKELSHSPREREFCYKNKRERE
jgi:hypothetical protein